MSILNIEKIVPDDKKIKINGKLFIFPGSVPVDIVLKMTKLDNKLTENPTDFETLEGCVDLLYEIFCIKNNEVDKQWLLRNMDIEAYKAIVQYIFQGTAQDEMLEEDEEKKN